MIFQLFHEASNAFSAAQFQNPKREAENLLCTFFSIDRGIIYNEPQTVIEKDSIPLFYEVLQRRLKDEPLPYIIGRSDFYGCSLKITPAVLIPRQETEILVDKVVALLKTEDYHNKLLLDLCSGSGCMGIAIKKALPHLKVILSDCSEGALEISQENARMNGVDIETYLGDLFEPFKGQKFHYIVCNPPYISEEEYMTLDRSVKAFEPKLALVGGKNGLEYYERLSKELPMHLESNGKVWLEIGYNQEKSVQELFNQEFWKTRLCEADWSGKSRFFFLENE